MQEEDSLLVQSEPKSKTSGPLRFSELGKQRASQNSVYLTREACPKNMICIVCKVSKIEEEVANKNGIVVYCFS